MTYVYLLTIMHDGFDEKNVEKAVEDFDAKFINSSLRKPVITNVNSVTYTDYSQLTILSEENLENSYEDETIKYEILKLITNNSTFDSSLYQYVKIEFDDVIEE